jgi:hypothetical protein
MNKEILKRIKKTDNNEAVSQFFQLLNDLIRRLGIDPDDERLALNVRNDSRKRFSVNINGRLVLGLREGPEIGFMLDNVPYADIISKIKPEETENFEKGDEAKFAWFSMKSLKTETNFNWIREHWIAASTQYLPTQKRSQYRKHHISEMYKMGANPEKLESYFTAREVPQLDEGKIKEAIVAYSIALRETDWLTTHEGYKFKFLKWFADNIDLKTQDNNTIKAKIEESQNIAFHPGAKGVNFIKSIKRFNDEYISDSDLELIRPIASREKELTKDDTFSFGSLPKASCFLSLFTEGKYIAYDAESSPAYDKLKEGDHSPPIQGWNSFTFNQDFYLEIREQLIKNNFDTSPFKQILETQGLTVTQWNWIAQDFLLYVNREFKEQLEVPAYYCVGFTYNGNENQLPRFIDEGIWENGYDTKFAEIVKSVPVGSMLAAKTSYTKKVNGKMISILEVHNRARVIENSEDGNSLKVEWETDFTPFQLEGKGGYRSTISQVTNQENINLIFNQQASRTLMEPREEYNKVGMQAINTILYGPPGTGKTYTLSKEYFPKYTTSESSLSPEKYAENIIKDLTWWQVLVMVLSEMGSAKVNDIMDHPWMQIKSRHSASKNVRAAIWGQLQIHTTLDSKNVKYTNRQAPYVFDKLENSQWELLRSEAENDVPELLTLVDDIKTFKPRSDKQIKRYVFTTFHQSFSYEDFIEGIKPVMEESEGEVKYEIKSGVFKQLCTEARNDKDNRYAIFIDEINRGNVSAIFGELITLIEQDKREGQPNEMTATLPYSKEEFSVPNNVDIYGTMNTADRSVEALDSALRRRFSFEELRPKPELLAELNANANNIDGIDLVSLLKTINDRIELVLDKDHQIGHSYFIGVNSPTSLKEVFVNKVFPLLEEYFFGDFGKIGLIVGGAFIEEVKKDKKPKLPINFTYEDANYFTEKKVYKYIDSDKWDAKAFISVYEDVKTGE